MFMKGHPLPDLGLPFRRPPPGPYPMGPLPPRPPLPPEQYFGEKSGEFFHVTSSTMFDFSSASLKGHFYLWNYK